MVPIEGLMSDLIDRLAANPDACVDHRIWRQLLTYVPLGLEKRPVAFRYKNETDEWVLTKDEAETQRALDSGHDAQGLYVRGEPWDYGATVLQQTDNRSMTTGRPRKRGRLSSFNLRSIMP